ncbi:MAG: glycosyltransferase [Actinobacteria bacterium]|nr:glycosyltransferase [Actinomycetota bacterium]
MQTLLEKSTYQNLEFIVVADTPTPPEVRAELARLGGDRMMIVDYDQAFNFAVKNNIGVAHSSGEFVLLLNDDTEIISPDALETMLAFFADPTVGIVGPILHFEDGTIQSAGHIFSPDPTDMYRLQSADTRGAHNYVRVADVTQGLRGSRRPQHAVSRQLERHRLCPQSAAGWLSRHFHSARQVLSLRIKDARRFAHRSRSRQTRPPMGRHSRR